MEKRKEGKISKILLDKIKNEILEKGYNLSVVFAGKNKIKSLNKKYRKKNEPTDILSFAISDKMGEIFICLEIARQKSVEFVDSVSGSPISFKNYLLFLVIHGILHLKGFHHGVNMRRYELTYYSRHRHRHL